jgi:hypothetical protein
MSRSILCRPIRPLDIKNDWRGQRCGPAFRCQLCAGLCQAQVPPAERDSMIHLTLKFEREFLMSDAFHEYCAASTPVPIGTSSSDPRS